MLFVALIATVGCVTPGAVPCGDRTCPSDTVCYIQPATETPFCLSRAQDEACSTGSGTDDGQRCSGIGFVGVCEDHKCIPGCGDGEITGTEECDDGNFRSHDGCASSCLVETLSWEEKPDPWTGMFRHVAGYHPGGGPGPQTSRHNGFFVLLTGQSQSGLRTQQFLSRDVLNWQDEQKPLPSPRTGAAMTYDAQRNKLVLFGGRSTASALADTWEWDFVNGWVERTSLVASPPAREGAQLVYDVTRQRSVLFGGLGVTDFLDDTWEWDGTTWVNRTTSARPPARVGHAMAYDDSRDRVVLYGGKYLLAALADHWEYDNGTWTPISFGAPPGRRSDAVMAYDETRKVVLFGGFTEIAGETILANDTWQLNGSTWTQVASVAVPPPRASATLVAGPPPGPYSGAPPPFELYLVGGEQADGKPVLNDQWRLTANGWVEISPLLHPPARQGAPAVYVDRTQAIHVFGGFGTNIHDDVWSYVGESWTSPPSLPENRAFHAAAYDPLRDRLVMFGGREKTGISDDTYETPADNAFLWTLASPAVRPPARLGGVLTWDGSTLVLFGGTIASARVDDTWTFDGTTWTPEPKQGAWPSASSQAAAAYDYVHQRLVLVDHDGATWTHANRTWTKLVDAGAGPPARDDAALAFDWQTQRMVLLGGRSSPTDLLDDIWELDDATWRQVNVVGAGPLPRALFGFSSTLYKTETLLIGGTATGGQPGGDVWRLRYRAFDAIDEDCHNRGDDDGDRQVDGDDPDCCPFIGVCMLRD